MGFTSTGGTAIALFGCNPANGVCDGPHSAPSRDRRSPPHRVATWRIGRRETLPRQVNFLKSVAQCLGANIRAEPRATWR
jgi:hypothetical protein